MASYDSAVEAARAAYEASQAYEAVGGGGGHEHDLDGGGDRRRKREGEEEDEDESLYMLTSKKARRKPKVVIDKVHTGIDAPLSGPGKLGGQRGTLGTTSRFRGVTAAGNVGKGQRPTRWKARFCAGGTKKYLGSFKSEEEAARARLLLFSSPPCSSRLPYTAAY